MPQARENRPSRDWFKLCIWLGKRMARVFWTNYRTWRDKTKANMYNCWHLIGLKLSEITNCVKLFSILATASSMTREYWAYVHFTVDYAVLSAYSSAYNGFHHSKGFYFIFFCNGQTYDITQLPCLPLVCLTLNLPMAFDTLNLHL